MEVSTGKTAIQAIHGRLSIATLDYRRGYIKHFCQAQGKCKKHVFQQEQHHAPIPCFFTARDGSAIGHRIPARMRKRCFNRGQGQHSRPAYKNTFDWLDISLHKHPKSSRWLSIPSYPNEFCLPWRRVCLREETENPETHWRSVIFPVNIAVFGYTQYTYMYHGWFPCVCTMADFLDSDLMPYVSRQFPIQCFVASLFHSSVSAEVDAARAKFDLIWSCTDVKSCPNWSARII